MLVASVHTDVVPTSRNLTVGDWKRPKHMGGACGCPSIVALSVLLLASDRLITRAV